MKKAAYKFHTDRGRMGSLEGLFVSTKERVDTLVESGIVVYFGEVLGKHSKVYGSLNQEDFTFISDHPEVVDIVEKFDLTNGYDPFSYSSLNFDPTEYGLEEDALDEDDSIGEIVDLLIKRNVK